MRLFRALRLYWRVFRASEWSCGWESRRTWPEKPLLGIYLDFCDGHYLSLHLGPVWVEVFF